MLSGEVIRKWKKKEFSLLSVFVVSLTITMFFCVIYKSECLLQSQVLSRESLSLLKTQTFTKGTLFLYLIQRRMWIIPMLFLFSTTYLATPIVYGTIIRYGMALGSVLALLLLRYGIKGVLFLGLCSFPQYLFYLPACIIAIRLCITKRVPDQRFYLQFFVLELVILIGCFMESFVNPTIIRNVLKIFIGV